LRDSVLMWGRVLFSIVFFAVLVLLVAIHILGSADVVRAFEQGLEHRLTVESRDAWLGGVPLGDVSSYVVPRNASPYESLHSEGKVKAVVIVARHCDRAPQNYAPAYATGTRRRPYKPFPFDKTKWDVDYGELTALGMYQCYRFGRFLHERYVQGHPNDRLLRARYNHEETHVRATDVDRTLVSAAAVMHGLYPAASNPSHQRRHRYSKKQYHIPGGFQYVPIHTRLYGDDRLLDGSGKGRCQLWDIVSKKMLKSDFVYGELQRRSDLYAALPSLANVSVEAFQSMKKKKKLALAATLRDIRICQKSHSIPAPATVSRFDADLEVLTARLNGAKWDASGLGPLVGGRLLRSISTRLATAIEADNGNMQVLARAKDECNRKGHDGDEIGNCYRKLVYYSGHDTTIFDIRAALGVTAIEDGIAPYASHVIFELRRTGPEENDFRVSVYAGHYDQKPRPLFGPFCDGNFSCTASSFFSWVLNTVPNNVSEACIRTELAPDILRRALGNVAKEDNAFQSGHKAVREQSASGGAFSRQFARVLIIGTIGFILVLSAPIVFRLRRTSIRSEYAAV